MKKLPFFALIVLFTINSYAQIDTIYNENKVLITAKVSKLEEQKNKDLYTVLVKVSNQNNYDLFYGVDGTKTATSFEFKLIETKGFAAIEIKNGTGFFGDYVHLIGKQTNFFTDNSILFRYAANSTTSFDKDFKVEKGVKPLLRFKNLRELNKLSDFSISNLESIIDGTYTNSCGNGTFTLTVKQGGIAQSINTNTINWLSISKNTFSKADKSATITFNAASNSFNYSSIEGISCIWKKAN